MIVKQELMFYKSSVQLQRHNYVLSMQTHSILLPEADLVSRNHNTQNVQDVFFKVTRAQTDF